MSLTSIFATKATPPPAIVLAGIAAPSMLPALGRPIEGPAPDRASNLSAISQANNGRLAQAEQVQSRVTTGKEQIKRAMNAATDGPAPAATASLSAGLLRAVMPMAAPTVNSSPYNQSFFPTYSSAKPGERGAKAKKDDDTAFSAFRSAPSPSESQAMQFNRPADVRAFASASQRGARRGMALDNVGAFSDASNTGNSLRDIAAIKVSLDKAGLSAARVIKSEYPAAIGKIEQRRENGLVLTAGNAAGAVAQGASISRASAGTFVARGV